MVKKPTFKKIRGNAYLRRKVEVKPAATGRHFIREWREHLGWSQVRWGELSGVDDGSISGYESGKFDPSLDSLQKLAEAAEITPGMLLDVDPTADPPLWLGVLKAMQAKKGKDVSRIINAMIGSDQPLRVQ